MSLSPMTRLAGSLVALALLSDPTFASPPSAQESSVPPVLILVGRDAIGNVDPVGEFTVTCRDISRNPEAGASIELDFTLCADARISSDQQPSSTANCPSHSVIASTLTDVEGVATLRVVGHADHAAFATSGGTLRVYANGVLLRTIPVAALDHDGGGLGPGDLALWLGDHFGPVPVARSDYDGDGAIGPADLSIWMQAFFAGGSVQGGSAPDCP